MIALAVALVIVLAGGFGLRLYMSRDAENRLRPGEDVTLAGFAGPVPANGALACPPDYCAAAGAIASPVFPVGAERLAGYWSEMMADEPRWILVAPEDAVRRHEDGALHRVVVQRSALLHFPDVVTVEFVSLGPDRSSLAIYSRARYGRSDFGVNRQRIERWLGKVKGLAAKGR